MKLHQISINEIIDAFVLSRQPGVGAVEFRKQVAEKKRHLRRNKAPTVASAEATHSQTLTSAGDATQMGSSKSRGGQKTKATLDEAIPRVRQFLRMGHHALIVSQPHYPKQLLQMSEAPPILFVCGDPTLLSTQTLALVGTRRCSDQTALWSFLLGYISSQLGNTVVSGAALGIDISATQGAVFQGGKTISVLGCGADIDYPKEHSSWLRVLRTCGAVVSEFAPGTQVRSSFLVTRNRIVAGLAAKVLLVDVPKSSGAWVTAKWALSLKRPVAWICPGENDEEQCPLSKKYRNDIIRLKTWFEAVRWLVSNLEIGAIMSTYQEHFCSLDHIHWDQQLAEAVTTIANKHAVFRSLIRSVGPCTLAPRPAHESFRSLCRAVLGQQLSLAAASTITRRIDALANQADRGALSSAEDLLRFRSDQLIAAGASSSKANTLLQLAVHVASGALDLELLNELPNNEITEKLVSFAGVGSWTAQMYLIFHLCRLDVWPEQDGSIPRAIQRCFSTPDIPTPQVVSALGAELHPFQTVAAWYLWRSLDLADRTFFDLDARSVTTAAR